MVWINRYIRKIYFFQSHTHSNIYITNAEACFLYLCICEESKVGLLKGFPGAEERLHLFEADIYKPQEFEKAIQGCVFVFHVATPLFHTTGYKYNDVVEATIGAAKTIANACINSGTVKRLIYTSSVVAASPLKYDGSGYKITIDESCWTPLHLSVPFAGDSVQNYTPAKTKSEQELLKILEQKPNGLEVVTLGLGLVGGGVPSTTTLVIVSPITNNVIRYQEQRYLEALLGKVPIIHIEDACRAHIFCAETPSLKGRFLCASSFVSCAEIAKYYQKAYPQLNHEYLEEHGKEVKWGSRKLEDKGFSYKYSMEMILDDCLECAKRSGIV
ncbi:putative anthocyanidin reductase ((2R,3R)-flavan-3-ol-forming) [Helianthus annuus]|nr:putative anthocyanidin reductase ((2R,3R)-flavan-3-ol-forming) [Helianthus annuus]